MSVVGTIATWLVAFIGLCGLVCAACWAADRALAKFMGLVHGVQWVSKFGQYVRMERARVQSEADTKAIAEANRAAGKPMPEPWSPETEALIKDAMQRQGHL